MGRQGQNKSGFAKGDTFLRTAVAAGATMSLAACASLGAPLGGQVAPPMPEGNYTALAGNSYVVKGSPAAARAILDANLNNIGAAYHESLQGADVIVITGYYPERRQPGVRRTYATSFFFSLAAVYQRDCTNVMVKYDTLSKGDGEPDFTKSSDFPFAGSPRMLSPILAALRQNPCR